MNHTVNIPASFFLNEAKHEYYDYRARLIAELLQNSLDAGASAIALDFMSDGYSCRDNGRGMTQDRMVKALLTMGGSVKEGAATGGFGAAKKLLLFAHKNFTIHSNNTMVQGSGLAYNFVDCHNNNGTAISAVYDASFNGHVDTMVAKAQALLSKCDLRKRVRISINGVYFNNWLTLPHARSVDGLGEVYSNRRDDGSSGLYIRHNGLFMFERHISGLKRKVVIEVSGNSTELFTQNRDGFRGDYNTNFDNFVSELTADKNSFVKAKQRKYVLSGVQAFINHISRAINITPDIQAAINSVRLSGASFTSASFAAAVAEKVADKTVAEKIVAFAQNDLQTDFHFDLADSKYTKVPEKYIPNVGKPKYTNLAALWKVCVREVLNANGINQQFIIGFTFDSSTVANHSMKNGVSCYMINPNSSVIDEGSKEEKVMSILTTAVHEVVHSQGCQYHDENFVLKFHALLLPTLTKAPTWRKLVKMAKTEKV